MSDREDRMQSPDETGALLKSLIAERGPPRTHLLVAEDDDATRTLLKKMLESVGHKVTAFSDGEAALGAVLENPGQFDLLILDAMMPKISGFELCLRLRTVHDFTRLPILMLTAMADRRSRLKAHSLGASEYLTKPIDRVELLTRVDHQIKLRDFDALQRDYAAKLEAEVETLTKTLFHAERLAFLGTLAGGVGHELNNLTTVLQSSLHCLKREIAAGDAVDPETVEELDGVLAHLKNHGQQLLNLGRPAVALDATSDLNQVAKACVHTLHMTGRTKFVDVELEPCETNAVVPLPKERLEQVFFNLVGNAADAIRSFRDAKDGRITIHIRQANDAFVVEIADNGGGMTPQTEARLFEPYFTTKGPESGTGLGLVVVKQILESFGGHIELSTTKDEGTTFRVSLPCVPAFADAPAPTT